MLPHTVSDQPLVSVVISVFNSEATLEESLKSILNQTYQNLEIIVINDGSTDRSSCILKQLALEDIRIKIKNQDNAGLTISLNRGLRMATGKYIARQDADDISYPNRITKQIEILESDQNIVLCGGNCNTLYSDGHMTEWGWRSEEELKRIIPFKTPFAHSTAIMRAEDAKRLNGYDESFSTAQDMEFWIRLSQSGRVIMIKEPVITRTILDSSISVQKRWRQFYDAFRARWKHNPDKKFTVAFHTVRSILISYILPLMLSIRKNR